ncbi:peptidase S1 [Rhodobacterales bacterium HKCCE2091]|nr:peptidase S1 [Rhodobacterales bacterium HKCCE2091]
MRKILSRGRGVALALAALVLSAGLAQACPNYNNPTVFGTHTLVAGFLPDPYVRNLTAGGTVDLRTCGLPLGPGYVVSRPDFRLLYQGTSPTGSLTFILEARSNVDTILVVNAPDGSWHYNDDINLSAGNTNSAIRFTNPLSGQYDVWTGSYSRSSNNPAQLIITELVN